MPLADQPERPTIAGSLSPDLTVGEVETVPLEQTLIPGIESIDNPTCAGSQAPCEPVSDQTVGADEFSTDPVPACLADTQDPIRYVVHEEIARGGMGAILRGHDRNLRRELALKVLLESHQNKPAVVQRFIEEAQISGRLQHPGIVPVYDLGVLPDQRPYFSMKLVHGKTLAVLLAERTSPTDEQVKCLGIFEQVCQTVAYAHNQGIIHRDLKSSNVMVGEFGEVQVMDWGLGKVLGGIADAAQVRFEWTPIEDSGSGDATRCLDGCSAGGTTSHTVAGAVMGTPAYMPPEQARGELDRVDERADVFGLGAILCEILTSRPPYIGGTAMETLKLATEGDLAPCFQRLDACGADSDLIELAKQCLAAEPAGRLRHAGIVTEKITQFLESLQQRLRSVELERAAEAARAAEALHTVAETQAKARAERRARQLQLAMAATVAVLLGIGGIAASLIAVRQNLLKENALQAEKKAVLAREAESMAKLGAESEKARAEAEKRRADLTLADMLTSRGLLAAERLDAAQAALWFAHASDMAALAGDSGRAVDNRLRAQNWMRDAVVPVGALSFLDSATSLSFQPDGDLLLVRGASRTGVWNWREDALLPIPALNGQVTSACWSPDGTQLAIAHSGVVDSYVGLGILFDPTGGVLQVTGTVPGSGAADSGLEPGDVLAKLDGTPIDGPQAIVRLLNTKHVGDPVNVAVTRAGELREFSIELQRLTIPAANRQTLETVHRVTIWSLTEGTVVEEIPTSSPAGGLAYSPDGRFLAVGESQVGLWDLDKRVFLPHRWVHPQGVSSLVFTRTGDRLITTCDDKQVRVYAITEGAMPSSPLFDPVPHTPLSASPPALAADDRMLLTISGNFQVSAWSLADGKPVHGGQFSVQPRSLTRIVASHDQEWFVTGGNYGPEIRNASNPLLAGAYLGHTNLVRDFAFHPRESLLATISWDQTARFWSVPDGQPVGSPLPHTGSAEAIAWSSDGELFATSQGDGLVRVWRHPSRRVIRATVSGSGRRPRLSPDGSLVAPGTWHEAPTNLHSLGFRKFQVLRSEDGTPAGKPIELGGDLFDSCICTDNQSVAAVFLEGVSGKVGVWEIATGQPRFPPVELPGPGISVAARPGTTQVAVLCATGAGVVLDSQSGQVAFEFRHEGWVFGGENRVVRVDYSPDGASLVSLGDGFPNTLEIRDSGTGRMRFPPIIPGRDTGGRVRSFALSPDGRFVATAVNGRNYAQVWDLATGEARSAPLPHPGDFYGLFSLCFSPDGLRLLTGSKDGEARYWDWSSGKLACPPMSIGDEVNGLAITADGRRAVTAARGQSHPVDFWDLTTGKRIAPRVHVQAPPTEFLSAVVMTPDGRRALTSAQSSALAVIDLELLFQPTPTGLEGLKRQAELASGTQMISGDVSRLDREQWQRLWDEMPLEDRRGQITEFDSRSRTPPGPDPTADDRIGRYCVAGRWRLAAAAAVKQTENPLAYRTVWSKAAACLILANDRAGYRKLCGAMLDRFGTTTSWEEADSTCKSCLLLPDCVSLDSLPVKALVSGLEQPTRNPDFVGWGFGSLGLVHFRRGDWRQAADACELAHAYNHRQGMSGAVSLVVLCMAKHELGESAEARRILLEATRLIPGELATLGTSAPVGTTPVRNEAVHHDWLMAEILRREAARLISGSEDRPLDEATLRRRIDELLEAGELGTLRLLLLEAVEFDPSRAWVHAMLGSVSFDLGARDVGIESLRRAVELEPGSAFFHAALGMQLGQQGEHVAAVAELQRALEIEPDSPGAHSVLGQIQMNSGRFDDAVASFDKAILSDPQNPLLSHSRAEALRLQQLAPKLERLISGELMPTDNTERCDVARACIARREYLAAIRFTADALAADPALAEDPTNGLRYNGACCVALLVATSGEDDGLDEAERERLVEQAIDWLEAERLRLASLLRESLPAEAQPLRQMLRHWPNDRDLAGFRDPQTVSQFPERLQDRLTNFWSAVQTMLSAE